MTTIAEVPSPTHIVFGTDGWRARVADEFTFENVRRCADGAARTPGGQTRFNSSMRMALPRRTL